MGTNVTIAATPPAAPIVYGDSDNPQAGLILNQSTTNTLYIGNDTSVDPNDPLHNTPVPPGQYVPFDGTENIYGIAATGQTIPVSVMLGISGAPFNQNIEITGPTTVVISGTVQVDVANTPNVNVANTPTVNVGTVTGSVDIASVAGNVNVAGVAGTFPIGGNASLGSNTNVVIAALTTGTENIGDCSGYTAFNLNVSPWCTSQGSVGAPLTLLVELRWFADAAFTQQVDDEGGWIWVTSSAPTVQTAYIKGPMQGRYLQLAFTNVSAAASLTLNYQIYGTGRTLTKSYWYQPPPGVGQIASGITVLGAALPEVVNDDNLCLMSNVSVPASQTFWQPLAMKSPCTSSWYFQTSAVLSNAWALNVAAGLNNGAVVAGTGGQTAIWSPGNTAGTGFETQLVLPRAPSYFVVHSTATVPSIVVSGVAADL